MEVRAAHLAVLPSLSPAAVDAWRCVVSAFDKKRECAGVNRPRLHELDFAPLFPGESDGRIRRAKRGLEELQAAGLIEVGFRDRVTLLPGPDVSNPILRKRRAHLPHGFLLDGELTRTEFLVGAVAFARCGAVTKIEKRAMSTVGTIRRGDLAELLRVSEGTVSRCLNGRRGDGGPSPLAAYLGRAPLPRKPLRRTLQRVGGFFRVSYGGVRHRGPEWGEVAATEAVTTVTRPPSSGHQHHATPPPSRPPTSHPDGTVPSPDGVLRTPSSDVGTSTDPGACAPGGARGAGARRGWKSREPITRRHLRDAPWLVAFAERNRGWIAGVPPGADGLDQVLAAALQACQPWDENPVQDPGGLFMWLLRHPGSVPRHRREEGAGEARRFRHELAKRPDLPVSWRSDDPPRRPPRVAGKVGKDAGEWLAEHFPGLAARIVERQRGGSSDNTHSDESRRWGVSPDGDGRYRDPNLEES